MERSLYAYRYVDRHFDEIVQLLTDQPELVLQPATEAAQREVGTFVGHLHFDVKGFEVGRDVVIDLGQRQPMGKHTVSFPVTWQATDAAALFPAMSGHLEVAAMSFHPPISQVTFTGRYQPPFGPLGALGDVSIGRRIADAAAHHFVQDLVQRVEEQLSVPVG